MALRPIYHLGLAVLVALGLGAAAADADLAGLEILIEVGDQASDRLGDDFGLSDGAGDRDGSCGTRRIVGLCLSE